MDPRMERKLFIIVCVLLVILFAILTFYFMSNGSKESRTSSIKEGKYDLTVYKNEDGIFCFDESSDCQDKVMAIEVMTDDAVILDVTNDSKYVLYIDGGMKLYDSLNDRVKDIMLSGYDKYELGYDESTNEVKGILYYDDEEIRSEQSTNKIVGFYNLNSEKKMYEGVYDSLKVVGSMYLLGREIIDVNDVETGIENYLLNMEKEEVFLSKKGICEEYREINGFIVQSSGCIGLLSSTIYTKDLKEIVTNIEGYKWSLDNDGNLYVVNERSVNTYNLDGEVIGESQSYVNILQVIKDYIVYVDTGKLKITNEKDVNLDISDWGLENNYDGFTSGYRDSIEEVKEGIYINYYVEDQVVSYYFDEQAKSVTLIY